MYWNWRESQNLLLWSHLSSSAHCGAISRRVTSGPKVKSIEQIHTVERIYEHHPPSSLLIKHKFKCLPWNLFSENFQNTICSFFCGTSPLILFLYYFFAINYTIRRISLPLNNSGLKIVARARNTGHFQPFEKMLRNFLIKFKWALIWAPSMC